MTITFWVMRSKVNVFKASNNIEKQLSAAELPKFHAKLVECSQLPSQFWGEQSSSKETKCHICTKFSGIKVNDRRSKIKVAEWPNLDKNYIWALQSINFWKLKYLLG